MKTLLALLLLIPSLSWGDWCKWKSGGGVFEARDKSCPWKAEKISRPNNIDLAKGPIRMLDGHYYYDVKKSNQSKSSNNSNTIVSNKIDKKELKEQLKYWKSLLDDELISQKDYEAKKKNY